jgi:O-antigen ligase
MQENYTSIKATSTSATNDTLQIILLVLAFTGYPLSSFIPGNEISIVYRAIFLVLALIYLYQSYKAKKFVYSFGYGIFLFFWVIYSCRIVYDLSLNYNQLGRPGYDYILFGLLLSFLCSHCFFTYISDDTLKRLFHWLYYALLIFNVLGIIYLILFPPSDMDLFRAKVNPKVNPITTSILASFLIISSLYILVDKPKGIVISKWLMVIALITAFANIIIAVSKSPTIGLLLNIMILFGSHIWKNMLKIFFMITFLVLLFVVAYYNGLSDFIDVFVLRFTDYGDDVSTTERLLSFNGAVEQFKQSPLLGNFLEEKITQQYPHNPILESLMAIGIFGGMLFLILYLTSLFCGIQLFKHPASKWLGFFFVQIFVVYNVSGSLAFSYDYWYLYALAVTIFTIKTTEQKTNVLTL